jgi:hypothetical protein
MKMNELIALLFERFSQFAICGAVVIPQFGLDEIEVKFKTDVFAMWAGKSEGVSSGGGFARLDDIAFAINVKNGVESAGYQLKEAPLQVLVPVGLFAKLRRGSKMLLDAQRALK